MKIQAFIFDAGGTLIRPARPVGEIYAETVKRHGFEGDGAKLQDAFKQAFRELSKRPSDQVPRNGDDRVWWRKVVKRSLEIVDVPDWEAFESYFEELHGLFAMPHVWHVFPEAPNVLQELHDRGFRLAVLSNWDSRLRPVLEGLGIGRYFERLFISAEMGLEKPHPGIYGEVLKQMGLEASQVCMVGDEPVNDVETPRSLGWHAQLVERPGLDLRTCLLAELENTFPSPKMP